MRRRRSCSSDDELARCAAKVQRGGPGQRRSATIERWRSRARRSRSTRRLRRRGACSPRRCRTTAERARRSTRRSLRRIAIASACPPLERDLVVARYYRIGSGARPCARDRGVRGHPPPRRHAPPILVNLGEQLRQRREFARAESLNVEAVRLLARQWHAARQHGRDAVESGKAQGGSGDGRAPERVVAGLSAKGNQLLVWFAAGADDTLRGRKSTV